MIEKAKTSDREAIVSLSTLLNEDDKTKTITNIRVSVDHALRNGLVWVAKDSNKVIGYVLCELFDEAQRNFPNSIFISELFVLYEYRKQGLGKALVKQVLASKFPQKYTYFSITHDPEVKFLTDYYKSLGFEEVGVTDAGNIKLVNKATG